MTSPSAPQVVPAFDQLQAQVEAGVGIVARFPGIVAVCGAVPPEKTSLLNRFLLICSEVSASGARSPGRRLARQLAGWLAHLDDAPTLGTISPTDGGLAIFLSGAACVQVAADGQRLTGSESAGWLDRIIDWPSALAISVDPEQGMGFMPSVFDLRQGVVPGVGVVLLPPRPPDPTSAGRHASVAPVPPASGADIGEPVSPAPSVASDVAEEAEPAPEMAAPGMAKAPPSAPAAAAPPSAPAAAEPPPSEPPPSEPPPSEPPPSEPPPSEPPPPAVSPSPPPPAPSAPPPAPPPVVAPAPDPAGPVAPAVGVPIPSEPRPPLVPPIRSARIDGAQQHEPPRAPLPLPSVVGEPIVTPESDGTPKVQGFLCSRGHLNDPRGLFCGICGIRMAERTGILTIGRRPPLGLLVFDDGVTYTVDADYLLGREPDSDPRVRQGLVRPLVVVDNSGAVSRRHCEIRLDGWVPLLSDIGSANGTYVAPRGEQNWSALLPQHPVALLAGTRIRLGNRMLVFESPHGAP